MCALADWHRILDQDGFATLDDVDELVVRQLAAELGRAGSPHRLTPTARQDADGWSLSGVYGLDAFPWHTDGAVSCHPPRWVFLRAADTSADTAPTLLLTPSPPVLAGLRRTVLRVTDRHGRVRYLSAATPAGSGRWRLRWDPRACTPRTGITLETIAALPATAAVSWQEGRLLILDNHRLMHRRPPIDADAVRVLERTYVWDE